MNNKENALESVDDDGWFHSGDLYKVDEEGFYTVVGRIKEIIITAGGENQGLKSIGNAGTSFPGRQR